MKEYQWPVRVYYEDTDAGGVVYHARYIAFYERARTELLREHGFSQEALLKDNLAFVVTKLNVEYKIPAKLDDLLIVKTKLKELKKASIIFEQVICDQSNLVYSSLEVVVACVDLKRKKPCGLPQAFVTPFLSDKGCE